MNGSPRNPSRCTAITENNLEDTKPEMACEYLLVMTGSVVSSFSAHKHITISRPRNETREDKKARKMAARSEKQNRRIEKQEMKEQFAAELKVQKRVLANKTQRVKRL